MTDSVQKLKDQLEDPALKENFADCIAIGSLLIGCVIGKQYRVPDALVTPIVLSDLGREVAAGVLAKNKRSKPNEVKLAAFLHFGSPAGLLFEPTTDAVALRQGISSEMRAQKILFPYIFGRDLHDLAAEQYPEKTRLNNLQSIALLKQLPQGVFQEGRTVTGPLGALASECHRTIPSRIAVPGYLCSDETCTAVHSLQLDTADSAVVRAREQVAEYIARHHGGTDDEHARLINEASVLHYDARFRGPSEGMFDTLADSCTVDELRTITEFVLRNGSRESEGQSRISKRLGAIIKSPATYVASLERPTLLQILMTFSNESVIAATDSAIELGQIELAEYEVRVAQLNRSGNADWGVEIGPRGVRSRAPQAVAFRLYALLQNLYFESEILEADDLAYALEVTGSAAVGDLLGQAVRQLTPRKLLEDLVLVNRLAAAAACDFLGITRKAGASRSEILESMLWKLGAPTEITFTELSRMANFAKELAQANEQEDPQETIRGHISNLFTAIEDALQRALIFSTWALTNDHFMSQDRFEYDPMLNVSHLDYLDLQTPTENDALRLKKDGKNTLVPLAAGFGRLAKALKASNEMVTTRPEDQLPIICKFESRPFAFAYPLPFSNMESKSQEILTQKLSEIAAHFSDPVVAKVRNSIIHGNAEFPSNTEITLALEKIESARESLTVTGIFPQVFSLARDEIDAFGRREVQYVRGAHTVSLNTPVWPVVSGMPLKEAYLIVMEGASLGAAGLIRFRLKPRPGEDTFWDDWPRRWRIERTYSGPETAEPSGLTSARDTPANAG